MSTTTLEAPRAELPRLDWPFLLAAVLGAAVLVALVWLDGHPASAALVILGFALGAAFLKTEFSFTAAWRRFLVTGEAGGMLGALLLTAVAALVIVPVAALVPGFGGAIAPIGPSLVDRRVRVRHRHAARERLRLRHALHRGRRLGPHADRARAVHRRQRDRQSASAGVPSARRHRSGARRRTISAHGAGSR